MWVLACPIAVKAGNGLAVVTGSALAFPIAEVVPLFEE
jgi:hypothetical protein